MFQTKDSGKREEFASGMVRDTQEGKARFDLIFPKGVPYDDQMFTRVAQLMERGMAKYGERNWEKANSADELERAMASALRHVMQWYNGEKDEDHAAATIFNLIAAETIAYKLAQKTPQKNYERYMDEPCEYTGKPRRKCVDSAGNPMHSDGYIKMYEEEPGVGW